jgi:hypothetical protein
MAANAYPPTGASKIALAHWLVKRKLVSEANIELDDADTASRIRAIESGRYYQNPLSCQQCGGIISLGALHRDPKTIACKRCVSSAGAKDPDEELVAEIRNFRNKPVLQGY